MPPEFTFGMFQITTSYIWKEGWTRCCLSYFGYIKTIACWLSTYKGAYLMPENRDSF